MSSRTKVSVYGILMFISWVTFIYAGFAYLWWLWLTAQLAFFAFCFLFGRSLADRRRELNSTKE